MRVLMLEWALFGLSICVGLLALVQLPVEWLSAKVQRWIDALEADHWLAVVERKTGRQARTQRRWRGRP